MDQIGTINYILALGTVGLQIITLTMVGSFLLRNRFSVCADVARSVSERSLPIAFIVSLVSAALTLYYSDVLGFEPCPLCWWQRIFLYPQVLMFGMALWKRDLYIAEYSIVLSVFGALVALYQHALQMLPGSGLPCPATGVSCATRIVFEFGYVTFPLMAFSLFVFLTITMMIARVYRNNESV